MEKYGRLNRDTVFYCKGTEFEITDEDEGMWSLNPFYSGRINGMYVSFEQKSVDIIYDDSYSGKVLEQSQRVEREEEWWEYTNYP